MLPEIFLQVFKSYLTDMHSPRTRSDKILKTKAVKRGPAPPLSEIYTAKPWSQVRYHLMNIVDGTWREGNSPGIAEYIIRAAYHGYVLCRTRVCVSPLPENALNKYMVKT